MHVTYMEVWNIATVRVTASVCLGVPAELLAGCAPFCAMEVELLIKVAILWMTWRNLEMTIMLLKQQTSRIGSDV